VGTRVALTRLSEQLVAVVEETMPLAQVSLDSPHPGGAQVLQEREPPVFRTEVTPCYRRNLHTDSGSSPACSSPPADRCLARAPTHDRRHCPWLHHPPRLSKPAQSSSIPTWRLTIGWRCCTCCADQTWT